MAEDSGQVHLAPFGHVYIAPLGTPLPTNVTTPMATVDPDYRELGLLSEDGVSLTPNVDTTEIKAWQVATAVKTVVTGVGLQAKFSMMQVTSDSTAEYFFGGAWTNSGGLGRLGFSSNPPLQERVLVVEWTDEKGNVSRIVFGRGTIGDRDALQLQRTENLAFGLTFECLDHNGELGFMLTNDPDLIPST